MRLVEFDSVDQASTFAKWPVLRVTWSLILQSSRASLHWHREREEHIWHPGILEPQAWTHARFSIWENNLLALLQRISRGSHFPWPICQCLSLYFWKSGSAELPVQPLLWASHYHHPPPECKVWHAMLASLRSGADPIPRKRWAESQVQHYLAGALHMSDPQDIASWWWRTGVIDHDFRFRSQIWPTVICFSDI